MKALKFGAGILRRLCPALLASLIAASGVSQAAKVSQEDWKQLTQEAVTREAVSVSVHLAPASLQEIQSDLPGVRAAMKARADRLLAELGSEAWTEGKWENGIGQMGVYVTAAGLRYLQSTGVAVSFSPGNKWTNLPQFGNGDGRLDAIERKLDSERAVNVVVTLDAPSLEYDLSRDGSWKFVSQEQWKAEAKAQLDTLLAVAGSQVRVIGNPAQTLPDVSMRTNLRGLLRLVDSGLVRTVRAEGFADARPGRFDTEVLQEARRSGSADVVVTLRDPVDSLGLPARGKEAALKSRKDALDAALAQAGVPAGRLQDFSIFGAMAGRMSSPELEALKRANDRRILSVELNAPAATAQLGTSTKTLNMPGAWSAGYRAAGQNIVVMDTGVSSGHPFFRNASGTSRVGYEGCFGTNGTVTANGISTTYQSVCPGQGQGAGAGDSPMGLVGSAAPLSNCSSDDKNSCSHGTHVAGISAGRAGSGIPAGVQGVAPEAGIVALQVFSFDKARKAAPVAFTADTLAAMQAAAAAVNPSTTLNPYVVNLSLGGALFQGPCGTANTSFTTAVATLTNAGVPVVVATGNSKPPANGSDTSISWPACVPKVIKVSAVDNDGIGLTRATYAHLAPASLFPGEQFWLAPGGGGSTDVSSSTLTGFGAMRGTSQATPHVAGLYAVIKAASPGITVAGATAWLMANAAVPVQVSLSGVRQTFSGIRLPNF